MKPKLILTKPPEVNTILTGVGIRSKRKQKQKDVMVHIQTQDDIWFCALITKAAEKGWLGSNISYLKWNKEVCSQQELLIS